MIKIAGTVIWYNPVVENLMNILSYIDYLDVLFIIDNSKISNQDLIPKKLNKIVYIPNYKNAGVASALNQGGILALKKGYQWLLTIDQDSRFSKSMADAYFNCFLKLTHLNEIAIISPMHNLSANYDISNISYEYIEPLITMTSGNLLNLALFNKIGHFNEKLFIDEVDHDYCLRTIKKGYKIIQFKNIFLLHKLGEMMTIKKKNKEIYISTHSPIRMYYITRNNLYIYNNYWRDFPKFIKYRIKQYLRLVKNVIFYEKQKIQKLYNILIGIFDFFRGKYGEKD